MTYQVVSTDGVYTVGYYKGERWFPIEDYGSWDEAANAAEELNSPSLAKRIASLEAKIAEERATSAKVILHHLDIFTSCVALFALKTALLTKDIAVSDSANQLSLAVRELQQAINGQQEVS